MKKKIRKTFTLLATAVMGMALFTGCGAANSPSSSGETAEKKESAEMLKKLERLREAAEANDSETTITLLADMVPTFHHATVG